MSTVNANVRLGYQNATWFTTNAAVVLLSGQIVYRSTDGKYIIGDGVTAISGLTFYGGVSSSGLTVGTTTITSGTTTRILYNNSGVVGEYLVTGTGTTAVLSTSPTFTTDITTPLIIGGSAVGSVIQYKGTSGNGTSTVAAHQFLVGNNGATGAMSVYNGGQVNVGNYASPTAQRIFTVGQNSAFISFGSWISSTGLWGIWGNQTTPSDTNYTLGGSANTTILQGQGNIKFNSPNTTLYEITAANASTSVINHNFTTTASTGQTLSTNIPNFKVTGSTKQWATGALATQYFNYFSANTVSFVGASTATTVGNFVAEYPQGGTNATITTSAAIYVPTLALTNTTTGIGLYVVAPSGATNNFAGSFDGILKSTVNTGVITLRELVSSPAGTNAIYMGTAAPSATNYILAYDSSSTYLSVPGSNSVYIGNAAQLRVAPTALILSDAINLQFNTTTGTKIGTATTQKIGFWNATPIVQPTTAVAASTLTSNGGTTLTSTDTIDGYTLLQVVKALRNTGLLA